MNKRFPMGEMNLSLRMVVHFYGVLIGMNIKVELLLKLILQKKKPNHKKEMQVKRTSQQDNWVIMLNFVL